MSMPIGTAMLGGSAVEGMAGMAMGGMSAGAWSPVSAALFLAAWTVMMAAMMLPAAMPMILVFAAAQARRRRDVAVPTWIFVAGYLLVWAAVGLLVHALVQIGGAVATRLAVPERALWAPLALGATLVAAGLYQFTPAKHVCLGHCRSPSASWRGTGAMAGSARSRWACTTAPIAWAAAGRRSPCWSPPG
jgi:predicted metal-binding membrane protein